MVVCGFTVYISMPLSLAGLLCSGFSRVPGLRATGLIVGAIGFGLSVLGWIVIAAAVNRALL
jgi:hypothetical protein